MKRFGFIAIAGIFAAVSCTTSVVKEDKSQSSDQASTEAEKISVLDHASTTKDSITTKDGIVIKWFEHGNGEELKRGSVYYIDYKVTLDNGDVVDGNHLLRKDSIPFPIGFQMQGKGWDLALSNLKAGDFAEIYIPSELARGDKEIKGVIPANSNNTLKIRILEKMKPSRTVDGSKVWIFEENKSRKVLFDEDSKVTFHTMISTPSKANYVNTFRDNKPFELKLEDYGTIPGLKKALINAKSSDRMFVFIPSSEAYGNKGYQDVVKPNEDLLYNMMIMDVTNK